MPCGHNHHGAAQKVQHKKAEKREQLSLTSDNHRQHMNGHNHHKAKEAKSEETVCY